MERRTVSRFVAGHRTEAQPAIDLDALATLRELQEEGEPDLLSELVELFLTDAAPRLRSLWEAVDRSDAAVVETQAHALKGSCANFGARPMAEICERLQSVGHSGDVTNASGLLARLQAEFERVEDALSSELAEARA